MVAASDAWLASNRATLQFSVGLLLLLLLYKGSGWTRNADQTSRSGSRPDCLLAALDGGWRRAGPNSSRNLLDPQLHVAAWSAPVTLNNESLQFSWEWSKHATAQCSIRRHTTAEIRRLFAGKRVHFVGDSHVRYLHNHLAATLGGEVLPCACLGPLPRLVHARCNNVQLPPAAGEQMAKGAVPPQKVQTTPDSTRLSINVTSFASMARHVLLSW